MFPILFIVLNVWILKTIFKFELPIGFNSNKFYFVTLLPQSGFIQGINILLVIIYGRIGLLINLTL